MMAKPQTAALRWSGDQRLLAARSSRKTMIVNADERRSIESDNDGDHATLSGARG
jgi:hypothetical protein